MKSVDTFCKCADSFLIFVLHLNCKEKCFKFLLASMKTLTNSGDVTGSRIIISNSQRVGNLSSAFEKADSQSSSCDSKK
jgi:hypothetical protein